MFSLLQRSLAATTLHKSQVPKATPTHVLNDPKALNWSWVHWLHGIQGDHRPSPCFTLPQPALIFQHLIYWYTCSWMGSKSPVHKLFLFVTLPTVMRQRRRSQLLTMALSAARACPGSVNLCRTCIDRRWGIPNPLFFALGKNYAHCPFS